jgi:hypothetical protein
MGAQGRNSAPHTAGVFHGDEACVDEPVDYGGGPQAKRREDDQLHTWAAWGCTHMDMGHIATVGGHSQDGYRRVAQSSTPLAAPSGSVWRCRSRPCP